MSPEEEQPPYYQGERGRATAQHAILWDAWDAWDGRIDASDAAPICGMAADATGGAHANP